MDAVFSLETVLMQHENYAVTYTDAEMVPRTSKMTCTSNKRRKISNKKIQESSLQDWRRWENLNADILKNIFCRVPSNDLCKNVSSVCHSWRLTCWDLLFWNCNVLDLTAVTAYFGEVNSLTVNTKRLFKLECTPGFFGKFSLPGKYDQVAMKLMKLLQRIMEGDDAYGSPLESWRLSIRTIIIPFDLEISDKHLVYIAERSPGLERLLLLGAFRITGSGFAKAIENWKHVEEIHLGPVNDQEYAKIIQEIGRNCKGLNMLRICCLGFKLNKDNSQVIAENLPGLKKLGLEAADIFRMGIVTIFKMCGQLEEIYFADCFFLSNGDDLDNEDDEDARQYMDWPQTFTLNWIIDSEGFPDFQVKPDPDSLLNSEFDDWIYGWAELPCRVPQ